MAKGVSRLIVSIRWAAPSRRLAVRETGRPSAEEVRWANQLVNSLGTYAEVIRASSVEESACDLRGGGMWTATIEVTTAAQWRVVVRGSLRDQTSTQIFAAVFFSLVWTVHIVEVDVSNLIDDASKEMVRDLCAVHAQSFDRLMCT